MKTLPPFGSVKTLPSALAVPPSATNAASQAATHASFPLQSLTHFFRFARLGWSGIEASLNYALTRRSTGTSKQFVPSCTRYKANKNRSPRQRPNRGARALDAVGVAMVGDTGFEPV